MTTMEEGWRHTGGGKVGEGDRGTSKKKKKRKKETGGVGWRQTETNEEGDTGRIVSHTHTHTHTHTHL